jgi:dienelactone hydrolase
MMRRRIATLVAVAVLLTGMGVLSSCTAVRCVLMAHRTPHERPDRADPACGGWQRDDDVEGMKVYVKGNPADPPVLVMHEIPGLLPETVCFGNALVRRGYRVYMPLFFGRFGDDVSTLRRMAVCAGPSFNCVSTKESPVVSKLRLLRDRIAERHSGRKLGVIGMCMTGGMPLALADTHVAAVVLSQPALPFPITAATRRALGVSEASLAAAKSAGVFVLRIRFERDCLVPRERFDSIADAIPADHLETIQVPSTDPREHSVLTVESHNPHAREAIEQAFAFLDRHLGRNR